MRQTGNVLVILAKSSHEVFNRKSALGALVLSVANIIKAEGKTVYINGEELIGDEIVSDLPDYSNQSLKSKLKMFVPGVIKRYFRDKKNIKNVDQLSEKILDLNVKFDFIFEFYSFGSTVGLDVAKAQDVPLYQLYDNPIEGEYKIFNNNYKSPFHNLIRTKEVDSLAFANKIVVYSDAVKDYLLKISDNRIKEHQFVYFQNVDFTRFDVLNNEKSFDSPQINICFIGSFLKWHQVDFLIEAFKKVIESGIRAKLFLVGDGMERMNIQKQVDSLTEEIKSQIEFTGYLDGESLFNLKKEMHIGVMPGSNWYGAPSKIFEYGAMKMAVVAPNTPTISFLFNQDEVQLFEWKNQKDFTDKLLDLAKDRNKIKETSDILNQKIAATYNLENSKNFYKNLFQINVAD